MTALEIAGLRAWYGRSQILHGVDLRVPAATVLGLLGRNGSGRTTLLKSVLKLTQTQGAVRFDGRDLAALRTHEIARLGIGYVPEDRAIFPDLTVRENLAMGTPGAAPQWQGPAWTVDEFYERFPNLAARDGVPAGALSGGEQQMLTIARTLMGRPRLVMIDEPTEGLSQRMVEQVRSLLLDIAGRSVSILLVEQKLTIIPDVCSAIAVMGHGRTVFAGTLAEFRARPEIAAEWLEI